MQVPHIFSSFLFPLFRLPPSTSTCCALVLHLPVFISLCLASVLNRGCVALILGTFTTQPLEQELREQGCVWRGTGKELWIGNTGCRLQVRGGGGHTSLLSLLKGMISYNWINLSFFESLAGQDGSPSGKLSVFNRIDLSQVLPPVLTHLWFISLFVSSSLLCLPVV